MTFSRDIDTVEDVGESRSFSVRFRVGFDGDSSQDPGESSSRERCDFDLDGLCFGSFVGAMSACVDDMRELTSFSKASKCSFT